MILDILNLISYNNTDADKENILLKQKNNKTLQNVFYACYSPFIDFRIKNENIPIPISYTNGDLSLAIDILIDGLIIQKLRGKKAIYLCQDILFGLNNNNREILKRIFNRNLECDIKVSSINKVWPSLLLTKPKRLENDILIDNLFN